MTVTLWPVRSSPPADGAALAAPPVLAAGDAGAIDAAGLDVAESDVHAAPSQGHDCDHRDDPRSPSDPLLHDDLLSLNRDPVSRAASRVMSTGLIAGLTRVDRSSSARTMSSVGSSVRVRHRPVRRSVRGALVRPPARARRPAAGQWSAVDRNSPRVGCRRNRRSRYPSGTRRPASRSAPIAPRATTSLATKAASKVVRATGAGPSRGGRWGRRSRPARPEPDRT